MLFRSQKTKVDNELPEPTVIKSEDEWKQELTPEQYKVLRHQGTEAPFSGSYAITKDRGIYRCAGCGAELFSSATKFDSGTGWPSFTNPAVDENIVRVSDNSLFMHRIEVRCRHCGGHLGHVFDDGPRPTGQRYCINSAALQLDRSSQPNS